jgi:hypothetical protein
MRCSELGYLSQYCVRLQTGLAGFDPRQRQRIFPLTSMSRPALGPTQPPGQWVPVVLAEGKARRGVTLTTHSHLVPRSRMSRSYTSSPPSASMASIGTDFCIRYSVQKWPNTHPISSGILSDITREIRFSAKCKTYAIMNMAVRCWILKFQPTFSQNSVNESWVALARNFSRNLYCKGQR